jgi:gliding motility-associated-like protein
VVYAGADQSPCQGVSTVLQGSGAVTYNWDNGVVNNISFQQASGNMVYTVTGIDANGCFDTDQVTIAVISFPIPTFTFSGTGCVPLTVSLTNTTPNATDCIWSISNGETLNGCGSVTTTLTQPGCYDVALTTTVNGCSATFTATNIICAEAAPDANFSFNPTVVSTLDPQVQFFNGSTGASSYEWSFGDGSPLNTETDPNHTYPGETASNYEVMLIAYSLSGCTDTAYSYLVVEEELIYWVPNTFTPDDDSYNPLFQPVFTSGFDPYDFSLFIYNRWGEIIWESHNASVGWDGLYGGNLVQDGTYTWKIEFKTTMNDERIMNVGHVNVIR